MRWGWNDTSMEESSVTDTAMEGVHMSLLKLLKL